MTLQPYDHYAELGSKNAYDRWNSRMKFFVGVAALIGIGVALVIAHSIEYPVFGALVGGVVGYGIFRWIVYASASSTADGLYSADWCQERGMTSLGDDTFPNNAPYANSGDRRKASDAFEGEWNGLQTLFYNFTYTEDGFDEDDSDTDYYYKIMRLTGRELPVRQLTMRQRAGLNKLKIVSAIQSKVTSEKSVSLESTEFNEKWDLMIDDNADEIWIRRIFDPATITALNDGSFTIPDLQYYDRAWWFVENNHFAIADLEHWPAKQKLAADAVELLSRVQTL